MSSRFNKLVISDEPVEDLLADLAERNPKAVSPELREALTKRAIRDAATEPTDKENGEDHE